MPTEPSADRAGLGLHLPRFGLHVEGDPNIAEEGESANSLGGAVAKVFLVTTDDELAIARDTLAAGP